jgi:hypothetical protein
MSIFTFYRALQGLYPKSFRRQFSEEMLEVFRRKLEERLVTGKTPYLSFVLRECFGLLREAPSAWASVVLPKKKYITFSVPVLSAHFPRETAEDRASSTPKLQQLQNEATDCMQKAAARGDFEAAYRYECVAGRLQGLLHRRNYQSKSGQISTS